MPLSTWQGLMDRMKRAKYGVILFGSGDAAARGDRLESYAFLALTRDMNEHARFVCQPMGGPGNATGAANVLTCGTGYPFAVNLVRGYPRFSPGEYTTTENLSSGEADAALIVGGDPMSDLTQAAREHLERIPSIVLGPKETTTTRAAAVVFYTATYGINTAGTVFRMDGVPIPLRPALESPLPTDEQVLRAIEQRVRQLKAAEPS